MKFWEFIQRALSETDGVPSSMRVFNAWTIFLFILVMAFGFVYIVLIHPDLTIAYLGVISGVVTMVLGFKVLQKGSE